MNEEESGRCIEISKQKLKDGNRESALKFANKAVSLHASSTAKAWLVTVETSKPQPEIRKRSVPSDAPPTPARPYTPEQVASITQITAAKRKGDLYAILSLEKSCSDADVKRAYRKLALRLHPDKCSAPKTDEAFKAISHAFKVLSDEGKRRNYDVNGVDEEAGRGGQQQGNMFAGMNGMHNMHNMNAMNAEDLFSAFFNNQFGGGMNANMNGAHFQFGGGIPRTRRRQPHQRQEQQEEQQDPIGILRFLPVLLVFATPLLSAISMLFSDYVPSYSFNQSNTYSIPRFSKNWQVKYFVNRKDMNLDQDNNLKTLRKLERAIEEDTCHQERENQRYQIRQAYGFFSVDTERLKAAKAIELRACSELSRIGHPF